MTNLVRSLLQVCVNIQGEAANLQDLVRLVESMANTSIVAGPETRAKN